MGLVYVTDASASRPPEGWDGQGPWLNVGTNAMRWATGVRQHYETMLLVASYVHEAESRGMERPSGYTYYRSSDASCDPDPNADRCEGGQSRIPDQALPSLASTRTIEGLKDEMSWRLKKIGLYPVRITAYQTPMGTAPVVVARTADPTGFLNHHASASLELFGNSYDSIFYEVIDANGEPIRAVARSATLGSTYSFVPPDLRHLLDISG